MRLCKFAQDLAHVRFARIDCLIKAAYLLKDFFDEVKKRLPLSDITLAYYWEIRDLLEGKDVNIEKIEDREKGSGFISIDNNIICHIHRRLKF